MDVKLSDEQLNQIISKSILDALTPEKREALIEGAIVELLKKPASQYEKRSRLEVCFSNAVEGVAEKLIIELLSAEEYQQKFRSLIQTAFEKTFTPGTEEFDRVATRMADALQSVMYKER